jgi:hypothetical protein
METTTMVRRTAAGLAALTLLLAGCAPRGAAAAPDVDAAPVVQLPTQALVEPSDPDNPRLGPKVAEVGRTYPYDLYTHCGIAYARFGGAVWLAERPRPEPPLKPDAKGWLTYSGYTAGTMTLVDAAAARFVADTRYIEADDFVVDFRATEEPMPTCR